MECDQEALKIWEWAIIHKNLLSAAHIPGKLSTVADKESRSIHVDTEWMIQSKFLNLALEHLCFKLEIDLFATNINTQFEKNVAFRQDPGAMHIGSFSIYWWSNLKFYALPSISVIPRALSKLKPDSAEDIIVVSFCPFSCFVLKMLVSTPILLDIRKSMLYYHKLPARYIHCGKR